MGSKRLKVHLECKGFSKRTSCWKQSKVTYFSPWSWVFLTGTSGIFGTQAVWICTFCSTSAYFPLSNSFGVVLTLIAFAVESWGLEAAQLQAWQAFYDGVDGMSSCSKCSNRNDPCSCGWGSESWGPGVLCEGDSITKISLYQCGLSTVPKVASAHINSPVLPGTTALLVWLLPHHVRKESTAMLQSSPLQVALEPANQAHFV